MRILTPSLRRLLPALATAGLAVVAGCRSDHDFQEEARSLTQGGDPARGHALIRHHGCGACHVIPGVRGARGASGPSLATVRASSYVGGVLEHTPENLMRWIVDPPAVDPRTAMPPLGVTPQEARHIAAYLYALDH
jgi:cytochrome c